MEKKRKTILSVKPIFSEKIRDHMNCQTLFSGEKS